MWYLPKGEEKNWKIEAAAAMKGTSLVVGKAGAQRVGREDE